MTFALFAYNQESYVREAIEGAFSQTYSPLEIILSDDCSADGTFTLMKKLADAYVGPHRIILNRNDRNLGLGRHFSRVMELASGEIVELAAGDDISLPWRTTDSVSILEEHPDLTCVSLGFQHFTERSLVEPVTRCEISSIKKWTLNDYLYTPGFFVNAPGRAFRKFTHDFYGPLLDECPVEDGPNLIRCLLHGNAGCCESIGVLYRWSGTNMSSPAGLRRIRFSSIERDTLNTLHIARSKGQIDESTYASLCKIFEDQIARHLLIEKLRHNEPRLSFLMEIFRSRDFPSLERLKLMVKTLLLCSGVKRWPV